MRLPQPFYRLNLRFDAARLAAEAAALPESAWAKHPNDIEGNSSVRLVSVEGGANDTVNGRMAMTPSLRRSPYIRQILASFGVVWGRSRLMRLAAGATVPQHADINYHWFTRVRLHIPIITRDAVRFYCGNESVHMAAGEAWIFDNWRLHRVENPTSHERIHLVADTSGSSSFWQFVARSQLPGAADEEHLFDAGRDAFPMTEQASLAPVMAPAEVDFLIMDMRAEIAAQSDGAESSARIGRYHALLESLCRDWRQLYLLHGAAESGWSEFAKLRDSVREASAGLGDGLLIRSNRVSVHSVLEGRVLRPMLTPNAAVENSARRSPRGSAAPPRAVFIVAAPRSGSTLLFESLAASDQLVTVGGEAHWLVEGIEELRVGAAGIDSNRLGSDAYTPAIAQRMRAALAERMVDAHGQPANALDGRRFLEKTPKNALRIPFFERVFPDAQYIFLWRDPRENLSSIIEAWRSGQYRTYPELAGFEGPWSLALPPGWRPLNGRTLEEIAAFQWDAVNRIVLDDLSQLPVQRRTAVRFSDLIASPRATIERLCAFLGMDVDPALSRRIDAPLPPSRYTHTAPAVDKWQMNAALIERVLPAVSATWQRLQALR